MIWLLDRIVRALTKPVLLREVRKPPQFAHVIVMLHGAALRRSTWLVPRRKSAITLGNMIVFRPGDETLGTLVHELVHVGQWRRFGFFGFLWRYVWRKQSLEYPAREAGDPYHVDGL